MYIYIYLAIVLHHYHVTQDHTKSHGRQLWVRDSASVTLLPENSVSKTGISHDSWVRDYSFCISFSLGPSHRAWPWSSYQQADSFPGCLSWNGFCDCQLPYFSPLTSGPALGLTLWASLLFHFGELSPEVFWVSKWRNSKLHLGYPSQTDFDQPGQVHISPLWVHWGRKM